MGRSAGTVKILPSAVHHWERWGLGLECENGTINLMFKAVLPPPKKNLEVNGAVYIWPCKAMAGGGGSKVLSRGGRG